MRESAWSAKHKMRRGYNGPTPVMYCRECKGSGASLTKHCAGRQLTDAEEAAIAEGTLEFAEGEWLHPSGVEACAPASDPVIAWLLVLNGEAVDSTVDRNEAGAWQANGGDVRALAERTHGVPILHEGQQHE